MNLMISLSYKFGSGSRVLHALSPTDQEFLGIYVSSCWWMVVISVKSGNYVVSCVCWAKTVFLSTLPYEFCISTLFPCFDDISVSMQSTLTCTFVMVRLETVCRYCGQNTFTEISALFSTGYSLKTNVSLLGRRWWSVTKVCVRVVCWITVGQCRVIWIEVLGVWLSSISEFGFIAEEFWHVRTTYGCTSVQGLLGFGFVAILGRRQRLPLIRDQICVDCSLLCNTSLVWVVCYGRGSDRFAGQYVLCRLSAQDHQSVHLHALLYRQRPDSFWPSTGLDGVRFFSVWKEACSASFQGHGWQCLQMWQWGSAP